MGAPRQLQACIVPCTVLYSPSWFTPLATERRAGMATGGGAEGSRLCPPPSAGAVRWAPIATGAALAPHPAFAGAGESRCCVAKPFLGAEGRPCHAGPAALGGLAAGRRLPGGCRRQLPAAVLPGQEQRVLGARCPPGSLLLRRVLPEDGRLLPGLPQRVPPRRRGLCGGALGAVERLQLPVRGGQQGPQPPGHRPAAARRGALSRPQAAPRLPGRAPDLRGGQRGGQDIARFLQPGLQGSLEKSWDAAAGGAIPVGPLCRGQAWSRRLHRDKQVCVECRGDSSQHRPHCTGHGLQGARTFWVAASVAGCQGSWVQEGLQEGCVCSPPALIFV
ncbi:uncharacterized protein ACIB01_015244 isoform 2-T3 [Guaruba guarouba]